MAPIALTCGEPAGVGPEIAVRAWRELRSDCPFVWIGDPRHLPPGTPFETLDDVFGAAAISQRALPVVAHPFAGEAVPGVPDPANAQGVIDVIERAVAMVNAGTASSICTAPIHKKALIDGAGFAYPGHTEFLGALAGGAQAVMMLACDELRVVPTTVHVALADVPRALTPELLRRTIEITADALRTRFGLPAPRIAVAGLNPHAGESGAMGREELDWIAPLLAQMRAEGHGLSGPHSADTLFHSRARAGYDAAVCMYHDQALIPIKTIDFDRGVNVTLGLPFIRTSPDHGTAFDIAGTGRANPGSLIAALRLAHRMARS